MSEPVVLFETDGHIAIFTLNREKQRNAVNAEVSSTLEGYLDQFEADDSLWIGIIKANGKVFCAGADLKSVSKGEQIMTEKGGFAGLVKYPRTKPIIAAIDGAALAGGCEIALASDLIVASTESRFGVPEVKRSLVPAAGGVFRLPRKLPRHIAMELVLTGDPISAQRAYDLGFINELVEPGKAFEGALALAKRIEVNAPLAVRQGMALVRDGVSATDEEAWQQSKDAMRFLVKTEDYYEGPKAFVEKRDPVWTGKMMPPRSKARL